MPQLAQVLKGKHPGPAALAQLPYRELPYSARNWGHPYHSFISYPSKLKPSIAHFLVRLFTKPGDTVLDPFSGCGTIPLEACLQGRVGIGSDLSPVAFHATQAKVAPSARDDVETCLDTLRIHIERTSDDRSPEEAEAELLAFYHPDTLKELLAARSALLSDKLESHVATSLLHILHGNRPYALSRRSHNIMPWPPQGEFIYKPVADHTAAKAQRMLKVSPADLPGFVRGRALMADAGRVPLAKGSVDVILTSPPFHGNRDFLRMNRIRLWLAGWDYAHQDALKRQFAEGFKTMDPYASILSEWRRLLAQGGTVVLHLGVVGRFDMGRELAPVAERTGFRAVRTIYEDTSALESHGIRDRGATQQHQFLILEAD